MQVKNETHRSQTISVQHVYTTSSKALTVTTQLSLALQHGSSLSLTVALHTLLLTAEMIDVKEFGHHEWNSNSCPSKVHVYASNYGD